MIRMFLLVTVLATSTEGYADSFPGELFGIPLGLVTTRTAENPQGEMPVTLTGVMPWRSGARYYYEPNEYTSDYVYLPETDGEDVSYSTNFYSIVLPIIPDEVSNLDEWIEFAADNGEQFQIMTIEHTSSEYRSPQDAYEVADARCESFQEELSMAPTREVSHTADSIGNPSRVCVFEDNGREFSVEQYNTKILHRLKYSDEHLFSRAASVQERIDSLIGETGESTSDKEG